MTFVLQLNKIIKINKENPFPSSKNKTKQNKMFQDYFGWIGQEKTKMLVSYNTQ